MITDGLSNTALMGECSGRTWQCQIGASPVCTNNVYIGGGGWSTPQNSVSPQGATFDGLKSNQGGCTMNCNNINNVFSMHSGGSNVLFADGSVHFISEEVDWQTFGHLLTRSYGDLVNTNSY